MEINSGDPKEDRALGCIEVAIAHLIKEDELSFIQSRALSSLVEIVADYITRVGEEAARFAEHGHRQMCKPIDIWRALESLGRPLDLTIFKDQGADPFGIDVLVATDDASDCKTAEPQNQPPLSEQSTNKIPAYLPRFPDLQVRKRTIDLLDALSNADFAPDETKRAKIACADPHAKFIEQQMQKREAERAKLHQEWETKTSFAQTAKEGQHFTEEEGAVQCSETVFEQCAVIEQSNLL